MGKTRSEYRVPLRPHDNIFGPMPMENSSTVTPDFFAAMKCPNSWEKTISVNIIIDAAAVITVDAKILHHPYQPIGQLATCSIHPSILYHQDTGSYDYYVSLKLFLPPRELN